MTLYRQAFIADKIASIVLAGGQGTRLMPLTQYRCKPAVSFGGRYRLIDIPISNSLNSHIRKIFIISQYLASGLHQHILSTYQLDLFEKGNIELLSSQEGENGQIFFNGTADAVRKNLDYILKSNVEYFLILSGDQLYNMDFVEMLAFAEKTGADLVIAAQAVDANDAKRMGLLQIDPTAKITSFIEKPQDPSVIAQYTIPKEVEKEHNLSLSLSPAHLGSMGIYIFKRQALIDLLQETGDDFGKDLIPKQLNKGNAYAFLYNGYWEDIGTIASYYKANLALMGNGTTLNMYDEKNPIFTTPHNLPSPWIRDTLISHSMISQGAVIAAKEITHSLIGTRTSIQEGTIIRDSVIIGNLTREKSQNSCSIGKDCLIEKAIIDEDAQIGDNVSLVNKEGIHSFDGEGVCIRDGIIIVKKGASIPNGFRL